MMQWSLAASFNLRSVAVGRATKVKLIFEVFWEVSRRMWAPADKSGLSRMERGDSGTRSEHGDAKVVRERSSLLTLIIH